MPYYSTSIKYDKLIKIKKSENYKISIVYLITAYGGKIASCSKCIRPGIRPAQQTENPKLKRMNRNCRFQKSHQANMT